MSNSSQTTLTVTRLVGEPAAVLSRWLEDAPAEAILLVDFELQQWWLEDSAALPLQAIYCRSGERLLCSVTDKTPAPPEVAACSQFCEWATLNQFAVFESGRALGLEPACIPKPWGQEIWFTGVEERGVCCFTDGQYSCPIPWVQAAAPGAFAGSPAEPLVLLKILDPVAQEVIGDLYFELHEEKREVYVVTHIDSEAWPDGIGGIRYGFDLDRLAESDGDEAFRRDYLAAVQDYEQVRRQIDGLPEGQTAPSELEEQEQLCRQVMNDFTNMRPLQVGDVVVVPLLMPHSLQHGVRTIEFQTPVYERQILSFAQKVLTQGHWDTVAAVRQMRLTSQEDKAFQLLQSETGITVERIVDFPDFEVRRVTISAGGSMALDAAPWYQLLMLIEGCMTLDGLRLEAEEAAFLPRGRPFQLCSSDPMQPLVLLLALPRR
ncbi:MAG: hypothetical protein P8P79_06725 [Halioglobus sp.]|nr:hypothetical protein [Halioglobus sp.]